MIIVEKGELVPRRVDKYVASYVGLGDMVEVIFAIQKKQREKKPFQKHCLARTKKQPYNSI